MPFKPEHSLYIRPTHIATENALGVRQANFSKLFVIISPVGPYYSKGIKPVSLLALKDHVRAWPGGAGEYKLGSNYAPTIGIQKMVENRGYD